MLTWAVHCAKTWPGLTPVDDCTTENRQLHSGRKARAACQGNCSAYQTLKQCNRFCFNTCGSSSALRGGGPSTTDRSIRSSSFESSNCASCSWSNICNHRNGSARIEERGSGERVSYSANKTAEGKVHSIAHLKVIKCHSIQGVFAPYLVVQAELVQP